MGLGATSDTLVVDNTDENSEMEIQEVLEKYQASIVENQSSAYETLELKEIEQTGEPALTVEETTSQATIEETIEETVEETVEETIEGDSQIVEDSVSTAPEVTEEEMKESQKEEEAKDTEVDSTDESTLAEIDEEMDKEVEKIAADLVAQNKTSEEDIKEAATIALQDGQAPIEVAQVETEAQVTTASVTDTTTPAMNTNSTGINYVETYHLTPEQIDIIKATIQHEAGFNPVEVEKVASTVINRCESGIWPGGTNPYGVILGKGQFQSYYAGHYKKYLNGNYADYTDQIVDAMLLGQQDPSHDFERFSSGPGATGTQFTKNGNFFR